MTEPSRPDSHERNGEHLACRFHPTLPQVSYNFFKAAGYETDQAQQVSGERWFSRTAEAIRRTLQPYEIPDTCVHEGLLAPKWREDGESLQ